MLLLDPDRVMVAAGRCAEEHPQPNDENAMCCLRRQCLGSRNQAPNWETRRCPRRLLECNIGGGSGLLPIRAPHAAGIGSMPAGHEDPFDLLLLSVCTQASARFVTADTKLLEYAERHTALTVVRA